MKKSQRAVRQWIWSLLAILIATSGCIPRDAASPTPPSPAATQPPATQQVATATASPTPTATPELEAAKPTQTQEVATTEPDIPLCEFAAEVTPEVRETSLDAYTFSEPRVVLTHTASIGIASWLPSTQQILITRRVSSQRESIEIYNAQTNSLLQYAERQVHYIKPLWLEEDQAIVFTDGSLDKPITLRVSYGANTPVEDLMTDLKTLYFAASPDNQQIIVFPKESRERPQLFNISQSRSQALPFALPSEEGVNLLALGQASGPDPYQVNWHPGGEWVAFYNDIGFYLMNWSSKQLCQVDLTQPGREVGASGALWAVFTQWSPDGRYLAMITTAGDPAVKFSNLTIFDTVDARAYAMPPIRDTYSGQYYVTDIAWSPDSQNIAVLIPVEIKDGVFSHGLYLVEAATTQSKRMLPETTFAAGSSGWNLAWSPNHQQIAIACPTMQEGRLCLITTDSQP